MYSRFLYTIAIAMNLLALHEGYLHLMSEKKADEEKPPVVEFVAGINLYTKNELRWYFGIETVEASDGKLVAIIPVKGVLSPSWNYGGTNTNWIQTQLRVASENPAVHAITLEIDSPGGAVANTQATAQVIKQVREKMPVLGFTRAIAASSAYWLLSHCDECFLENKIYSGVGSIGVMATLFSQSSYNEKNGYDFRVIRSKGSEDKNLANPMEPIHDAAVQEAQDLADKVRVEFLSAVLSVRPKVDPAISGKMYYGKDAISAGLADTVGDLNAALKRADYLARKR